MTDTVDKKPVAVFPWISLAVAVIVAAILIWMVNDVRVSIKENIRTLNENLPEILSNTKRSTATLAVLSEDIKNVRDLAGVAGGNRDRSLVSYADTLLDLIEESGGKIGVQKKIFGKGLKDVVPARQWSVAARKEGLWLSFRSHTKFELLTRLTKNRFGSEWHMQIDEKETSLIDWLASNDPVTAQVVQDHKMQEANQTEKENDN